MPKWYCTVYMTTEKSSRQNQIASANCSFKQWRPTSLQTFKNTYKLNKPRTNEHQFMVAILEANVALSGHILFPAPLPLSFPPSPLLLKSPFLENGKKTFAAGAEDGLSQKLWNTVNNLCELFKISNLFKVSLKLKCKWIIFFSDDHTFLVMFSMCIACSVTWNKMFIFVRKVVSCVQWTDQLILNRYPRDPLVNLNAGHFYQNPKWTILDIFLRLT